MTTTVTVEEAQVCVFIAVDHCTAEYIGIHPSKSGSRFETLEPLRQGVREHFGGFDRDIAMGLAIRHDHGSASYERRIPAGVGLPGHVQLTEFRSRTRGQWRRRAIRAHTQRELALGPSLRHGRGTDRGPPGVQS